MAYEITSAYWVFSVEKLKSYRAGFWSAVQAVVMLTGIAESIHDWRAALCFIVGYSLGSIIGVEIERKNAK